MKGQASIELLVTIGIVLSFTIPVLFLLVTVTSVGYENTAMAQAEASARSLADSINIVYGQGDKSKRVVLLNLPSNTNSVTVTDQGEVVISITTSSGEFEAVAPTFANVRPASLSRSSGKISGLLAIDIEAEAVGSDEEVQVWVELSD